MKKEHSCYSSSECMVHSKSINPISAPFSSFIPADMINSRNDADVSVFQEMEFLFESNNRWYQKSFTLVQKLSTLGVSSSSSSFPSAAGEQNTQHTPSIEDLTRKGAMYLHTAFPFLLSPSPSLQNNNQGTVIIQSTSLGISRSEKQGVPTWKICSFWD